MAARQNNSRPLSDALQITPRSRDWTVLVQCLAKSKLKVSQLGVPYRNYLFCDPKGTMISVMTYDQAILKFARILFPYKRYYISNANVKEAKPEYQVGEYGCNWTLYTRTPVDPLHDPVPGSLPCTFDFMRFEDMYRHADNDTPIAIRALVVASIIVRHPTNNSIRDYIVVNKEKRLMLLRLWDDALDNEEFHVSTRLPEPTIIVAGNLKVTTHHGLSLTTKKNHYFLLDPPLVEEDTLLDWYGKNVESVQKLLREHAYTDTSKLLPPPNDTMLVRLADFVANIDMVKVAWVAATLYMIPAQEKLWYSSCPHCGKSYNAPIGWETTCSSCGKETSLQPRCHIGVFLNDETKTLPATMFSPEADKLTGFTGPEIKEAADKNAPLTDEIATRIHKKPVICFLKCYDRCFRGTSEMTYPIVKIYTEQEIADARSTKPHEPEPLPDDQTTDPGSPKLLLKEQQFFSPNTKVAVEEIALSSTSMEKPSPICPNSKRGLLFTGECSEKPPTSPVPSLSSPSRTENVSSISHEVLESPGKKVKGKEDSLKGIAPS